MRGQESSVTPNSTSERLSSSAGTNSNVRDNFFQLSNRIEGCRTDS